MDANNNGGQPNRPPPPPGASGFVRDTGFGRPSRQAPYLPSLSLPPKGGFAGAVLAALLQPSFRLRRSYHVNILSSHGPYS